MIVSFDGPLLRAVALEQTTAGTRLGEFNAARLHAALAEIEASTAARDLLLLYGHAARAGDDGALVIELGPGLAARFSAVRDRDAVAGGRTEWAGVTRLKLVQLEVDGHGI